MTIPNVSLTLSEGALGIPAESTDSVICVLGYCSAGTAGTLYNFGNASPTNAKAALGVGKLAQCVAQILATPGHGTVIAIPIAATAGVNSAVSASGTSPPTTTLTGTPLDDYQLSIQCLSAGARGTATFRYSLDGGVNWSHELTTAATYAIAETGITINFANTAFSLDNAWTATCTAPTSSNTQVTDGLAALIAAGTDIGWVHVATTMGGAADTDRATAVASLFSAVDTKVSLLETSYKFVGCSIETGAPAAAA